MKELVGESCSVKMSAVLMWTNALGRGPTVGLKVLTENITWVLYVRSANSTLVSVTIKCCSGLNMSEVIAIGSLFHLVSNLPFNDELYIGFKTGINTVFVISSPMFLERLELQINSLIFLMKYCVAKTTNLKTIKYRFSSNWHRFNSIFRPTNDLSYLIILIITELTLPRVK